jgi:hypothetical protein
MATSVAARKSIGTGAISRFADSQAMISAMSPRMMALVKPLSAPTLPVPKVKRSSSACRRA